MAIKNSQEIKSSEITDKRVYLDRRLFMRAAGLVATTALTGWLYRRLNPPPAEKPKGETISNIVKPAPEDALNQGFTANEKLTTIEDITNYNNFYEFGMDKDVWPTAQSLKLRPWTIKIDGLVEKPMTLAIDDLLKQMPLEERLYRHRCVEAWSMAVPLSPSTWAMLTW